MSPTAAVAMCVRFSVPRASGDEPEEGDFDLLLKACSPRERG